MRLEPRILTQLTGVLGQLGAVTAAIPMTWALSTFGWSRAYLATAGIGAVLLVVALVAIVGIAILFDRISQAWGQRLQKHREASHV